MGLNDVGLNFLPMVTIYDVPADALIEAVAARLEDRIDEPDWVAFTKSGAPARAGRLLVRPVGEPAPESRPERADRNRAARHRVRLQKARLQPVRRPPRRARGRLPETDPRVAAGARGGRARHHRRRRGPSGLRRGRSVPLGGRNRGSRGTRSARARTLRLTPPAPFSRRRRLLSRGLLRLRGFSLDRRHTSYAAI